MDTREVIARFEAERQALALMDHPHIAKVLDAGATASGRPYFVMELVDGETITTFCNRNRLTIRDRLALFDQVCAAIQHAHSKGIIHRDLKPSNILVRMQDGEPAAKVIDFGIAKATTARLGENAMQTEANLVMGTPAYMSPEQATSSADIDTRSDIYALGVILYELLTDLTPFEARALNTGDCFEMQRIIRDVEPPRPSVRLAQVKVMQTQIANCRQSDPSGLVGTIRGELDWIVMKAIEKDRARRYDTASALADDVRRHLDGEPVFAAPPSTVYLVRKFVRRHKVVVAAGSLVALSLVAGIVAFAWQARVAQQRAAELDKVAKYQASMLDQIDPTQAGMALTKDVQDKYAAVLAEDGVPESQRAAQAAAFAAQWRRINATDAAVDLIDRTTLRPAVAAIDEQLKDQPLVAASLQHILAQRYMRIGNYDQAKLVLQRAVTTRRRLLGDGNEDTIDSMSEMANLLDLEGSYDEAAKQAAQVLALSRAHLGPDRRETLEAMGLTAQVLRDRGKRSEAEAVLRDLLARRMRLLGPRDKATLVSLGDLGGLLLEEGKAAEAEPMMRAAAKGFREVNGEFDTNTITATSNVGVLLARENRYVEAEPYIRQAVEGRRKALGADHPDTLFTEVIFGHVLLDMGRAGEAEPLLRAALDRSRKALGEDDATTLNAAAQLGRALVDRGRYADADALLTPGLETARKTLAEADPPRMVDYIVHLGRAHTGLHRFALAQAELTAAATLAGKIASRSPPAVVLADRAMADLYTAWNRAEPGKGYEKQAVHWRAEQGAAENVWTERKKTMMGTKGQGR